MSRSSLSLPSKNTRDNLGRSPGLQIILLPMPSHHTKTVAISLRVQIQESLSPDPELIIPNEHGFRRCLQWRVRSRFTRDSLFYPSKGSPKQIVFIWKSRFHSTEFRNMGCRWSQHEKFEGNVCPRQDFFPAPHRCVPSGDKSSCRKRQLIPQKDMHPTLIIFTGEKAAAGIIFLKK